MANLSHTAVRAPGLDDLAKPPAVQPQWVSAADTAVILGLSRATVSRLIRSGALPSRAVGRRKMVPLDALNALLAESMADFDPTGALLVRPGDKR